MLIARVGPPSSFFYFGVPKWFSQSILEKNSFLAALASGGEFPSIHQIAGCGKVKCCMTSNFFIPFAMQCDA